MTTERRAEERAALHGHPSAIEVIAADYPDWEIHREQTESGAHGDWIAARQAPQEAGQAERVQVRAPSPGQLLELIEESEMARLQRTYGATHRIWRTPHWWMANPLVPDLTPTEMEPTADALEARLRNPQRRMGRSLI